MADQDVHDRIAALEQQVDDLREQLAGLNKQLVEAQLDEWKGRIDELDLQAHLAQMNVADRLAPLFEVVRNRWLDAREQLTKAGDSATDVLGNVRDGVQQAVDDVRSSLRSALSSDS